MNDIFLAKRSGITLQEHSKHVSEFALAIAEMILTPNPYGKLKEPIRLSALLHDIGKIPIHFQVDYLENKDIEITEYKKVPYRHNEIGWAIVSKYLYLADSKLIADTICWHHGISNKMTDIVYNSTIIGCLLDNDRDKMIDYLKDVVGDSNIRTGGDAKRPDYFVQADTIEETGRKNNITAIVRTCIISADRIVSRLDDKVKDIKDIKQYLSSITNKHDVMPSHIVDLYDDDERFETQKKIAETTRKTMFNNAPAGFGKTLIGILWSLKSDKKLIWVCPRNFVATAVYETLNKELTILKEKNPDIKLSVELFLTGDVKKYEPVIKNDYGEVIEPKDKPGFESDIIITNIDNYLKPSIDSDIAERMFQILSCDVIFDEFHESISKEARYACFLNMLTTRHHNTNSRTLLLSATPVDISHRLGGHEGTWGEATHLPKKYEHYKPVHNKKYYVTCDNTAKIPESNCLIIFNATESAQLYKIKNPDYVLIHSKFEQADKDKTLRHIHDMYHEENRYITTDKINVISNHMIQAGADFSFMHLDEYVISPYSTMQRIGRINRWGEYGDNVCTINFRRGNNKSEDSAIENLYNNDLSNKWYNYLRREVGTGKYMNLEELYAFYNNFEKKWSESIRCKYTDRYLQESIVNLKKIYPVKYYNKGKRKTDNFLVDSNKLRCTQLNRWVTFRKEDGEYTEPFSITIYGGEFDYIFEEPNGIEKDIKAAMVEIHASHNDNKYDYHKMLELYPKLGIDKIRREARYAKTPYICFNMLYDKELGVVRKRILTK